MGTLYSQPVRNRYEFDLERWIEHAIKLAAELGISVAVVVAAKAAIEQERTNDLYAANGDVFDEQVAGIGLEMQAIASAIERLAWALEVHSQPPLEVQHD
jgi:sugar phosphate isomerase/epimerase